jgi:hypothetical protein
MDTATTHPNIDGDMLHDFVGGTTTVPSTLWTNSSIFRCAPSRLTRPGLRSCSELSALGGAHAEWSTFLRTKQRAVALLVMSTGASTENRWFVPPGLDSAHRPTRISYGGVMCDNSQVTIDAHALRERKVRPRVAHSADGLQI